MQRFLAGIEAEVAAEAVVDAVPAQEAQPEKAQRLRKTAVENDLPMATDTDASALVLPENGILIAVVFLLSLILYAFLRGGRKNQAKTQ